jgi:hypothetical protein
MFLSGMNPILGSLFTLTTLLIAIPSAVKTFNWLGTLWGARIQFTVPMLFALGFISTFISGGRSGVPVGRVLVGDSPDAMRTLVGLPGSQLYRQGSLRTFAFAETQWPKPPEKNRIS